MLARTSRTAVVVISLALVASCKSDGAGRDRGSEMALDFRRADREPRDYGPCGPPPDAFAGLPDCPPIDCYLCENQWKLGCSTVCYYRACIRCEAGRWGREAVDCDPFCHREARLPVKDAEIVDDRSLGE